MARKHEIRRGDGYIAERPSTSGETRYQARWKEPQPIGRIIWRSKSFGNVEDAEDHLRRIGREMRAGKYTPETTMTVAHAVSEYLQRGRLRWSTNTYASYRQVAETRVIPHLGKIRLPDLTPWQVQTWLDQLTASEYKPASVRNARIVLMGACKEAVRLGIMSTNPVEGTQVPSRLRRPPTIWNSDHITAVMNVVRDDVMMTGIYTVALTTGMRPGEIRNLKWKHVDFDELTILCEVSTTRDEQFRTIEGSTTKTRRSRHVPLTSVTADALQAVRRDQLKRRLAAEHWRDTDLIFDRGDGDLIAAESLRWKHLRTIESAGVPRIRLHDLRHTAATVMLKSGVALEVASRMLGHASLSITADIYGHIDVSMQRDAADTLGALIKKSP